MNLLNNSPTSLGLGIVIIAMVLAWVLGLVLGGFKFGRLEKRVALDVPRERLPGFLLASHQRAEQIGFVRAAGEGQFLQGKGASIGQLGELPHAGSRKQLSVTAALPEGPMATVEFKLWFLDTIVADTGESRYRDAVLDYVMGRTDSIQMIPNRSFMAFQSFVGGICAILAVFVLKALQVEPIFPPIAVAALTDIMAGALAIFAISRRPRELKGIGLAIGGIVTGAAAFAIALVMSFAVKG